MLHWFDRWSTRRNRVTLRASGATMVGHPTGLSSRWGLWLQRIFYSLGARFSRSCERAGKSSFRAVFGRTSYASIRCFREFRSVTGA